MFLGVRGISRVEHLEAILGLLLEQAPCHFAHRNNMIMENSKPSCSLGILKYIFCRVRYLMES